MFVFGMVILQLFCLSYFVMAADWQAHLDHLLSDNESGGSVSIGERTPPASPDPRLLWGRELNVLLPDDDSQLLQAPSWQASLDDLDSDADALSNPPASPLDEQNVAIVPFIDRLRDQPRHGNLTKHIQDSFQLSKCLPDGCIDSDIYETASYLLQAKTHDFSSSAEAASLKTTRKLLTNVRKATAAASIIQERMSWSDLCGNLKDASRQSPDRVKLKIFFEFSTYDGVDFHLGTDSTPGFSGPSLRDTPSTDLAVHALGGQVAKLVNAVTVSTCGRATKVLHSRQKEVVVVSVNGFLVIIKADMLAWLQASDRGTAENLVQMVGALGDVRNTDEFERKLRFAVTDAASANKRTERNTASQRPTWVASNFYCLAHKFQGNLTKALEPDASKVSGLIAFQLTLTAATSMAAWYTALKEGLRRTLSLTRTPLSDDAFAYKRMVLETFVGVTPDEFSTACFVYANGDWRNKAHFQVVVAEGDTFDTVFNTLATQFLPFFADKSGFKTFPRSRWSGIEASTKVSGVLSCIGNLMEDAFVELLIRSHGMARDVGHRALDIGAAGVLALEWEPMDIGAAAFADDVPINDPKTMKSLSLAEVNKNNRGSALTFVRWQPGLWMLTFRRNLDPFLEYRGIVIKTSSEHHDTREDAKGVRLVSEGSGGVASLLAGRTWQLLEAAKGTWDANFKAGLKPLERVGRFIAYPASALTLKFRHAVFRNLSRQGATHHEFIETVHADVNFQMYRLVEEPELKEVILASCESSRGDHLASLIRTYPNITSFDAQLELAIVVMNSALTTVPLENGNARICRQLKNRSNQSKKPDLATICADELLTLVRRREFRLRHPAGCKVKVARTRKTKRIRRKPKASASGGGVAGVARQQCAGGGGAWRAFIRDRCRCTCKAVFKSLADEYRQLTADEKSSYHDMGLLGTFVHSQGGVSFGKMTRELARAQASNQSQSRASVLERCIGADSRLVVSAQSVGWELRAGLVAAAKVDRLLLGRLARSRDEVAASEVADFALKDGVSAMHQVINRLPELANECIGFHTQSCNGTGAVMKWVCPLGKMVPRTLATIKKDSRAQSILDMLVSNLESKCKLFLHADQPSIEEDAKRKDTVKPPCAEVRVCICGPLGDMVFAAKRRLAALLNAFSKSSEFKDKLKAGDVVLRMTPVLNQPGASVDLVSGAELGGSELDVAIAAEKWLHVSYFHGNPKFPSFREVVICPCETRTLHLGHLTLQGTDKFYTVWEALKTLICPNVSSIALKCYSIFDSERLLHQCDASLIEIFKIIGVDDVSIELLKKRTKKQHAADRIGEWQGALDELSSSGHDDDDDDGDEGWADLADHSRNVA
jgi:hypothetical protein